MKKIVLAIALFILLQYNAHAQVNCITTAGVTQCSSGGTIINCITINGIVTCRQEEVWTTQ